MKTGSNFQRGTEYERFVQSLYQAALRAEGVENIAVQHDIRLRGQSGCDHQIDVYWEFKLAGQIYKTAIECKDFDKTIPVGRVRDFYGVVSDVPGLIGIFATKVGYQKGAINFAKQKGISLQIAREPTDTDWDGLLRTINIRMHAHMPQITRFEPRISEANLRFLIENGITEMQCEFSHNEPIIFDRSGNVISTFGQLYKHLPTGKGKAIDEKIFVPFSNHIFKYDKYEFEIEGIDLTYRIDVHEDEFIISGDEFVAGVIRDVSSGHLKFIDKPNSRRSIYGLR